MKKNHAVSFPRMRESIFLLDARFRGHDIFKNFFTALIILLFFQTAPVSANSLWNKGSASPYTQEKSYRVGDIITILIIESTSAQQKAGTKTDVKDDMGFKLTHTIDRLASLIPKSNEGVIQDSNKYTGSGTTQRASAVTSKIAAVVTEVMTNGNLQIEGRHKLDVNDESQEILISGIIRSKDISATNTIYSYQVANAEVSVRGTGVVQEAEAPGWLTRILNWLF